MPSSALTAQLIQRVERLLAHSDELVRANALLERQLSAVIVERDELKARMHAARQRVDALLQRVPELTTTLTTSDDEAN